MKYCQKCGAQNKPDAQFCVNCGAVFDHVEPNITQSQASQQQNVRPYTQPVTKQRPVQQPQSFNNVSKEVNDNSKLFLILGWISAAVSLFFIPIIFGGIGVSLGFAARKHNETQGLILIVASIICGILGIIIGAAIGAETY